MNFFAAVLQEGVGILILGLPVCYSIFYKKISKIMTRLPVQLGLRGKLVIGGIMDRGCRVLDMEFKKIVEDGTDIRL